MSKVFLNYGPIGSDGLNSLDSAISSLDSVINYLQQNSIPNDFYKFSTLVDTINELKNNRQSLVDLKTWLVNSNKSYDKFISKLEVYANRLPVYRVRRRSKIM